MRLRIRTKVEVTADVSNQNGGVLSENTINLCGRDVTVPTPDDLGTLNLCSTWCINLCWYKMVVGLNDKNVGLLSQNTINGCGKVVADVVGAVSGALSGIRI